MRGGKFSILEALTKLFADSMMGVSVAIAVVAFLRTTEFANLSLKSADIGSIIAISFILGFYHEDTRRLLGSFQKRISGAARESEKDE
jgi:energy-converting hydrogenase Eha subunit B